MLYLTIKGNRISNAIEKPFYSKKAFTLGAATSPYRCDDTSDPDHHQRSCIVIDFVKEALNESSYRLPDQSCGFWLGDMRDTSCHFFSWGAAYSSDYLIPDPHYLRSKGYLDLALQSRPWHLRENIIFWRGGLTRPLDQWEHDPTNFLRYKLTEQLASNPSCDVKLSFSEYGLIQGPCFGITAKERYNNQGNKNLQLLIRRAQKSLLYRLGFEELSDAFVEREIRMLTDRLQHQFVKECYRKGYISEPIPMNNWGSYRYTVDLDGFGPSWKLFPCLAQGMVVFKVESNFNLFFSSFLRPFEHYIPVRADLSDLQEKIDWALNHQNECNMISSNAIHFCANRFNYHSSLKSLAYSLAECH